MNKILTWIFELLYLVEFGSCNIIYLNGNRERERAWVGPFRYFTW